MTRALGSPYGVSGAATIHAGMGREFPRTLLRVEGFEDSVAYRAERLIALLAEFGAKHALRGEDSAPHVARDPRRRLSRRAARARVWRASLKPSDAPAALARARRAVARASLMDHGGGLVWFVDRSDAGGGDGRARRARPLRRPRELIRADAGLRGARRRVRAADAGARAADARASRRASTPAACSIPAACTRTSDANPFHRRAARRSAHRRP